MTATLSNMRMFSHVARIKRAAPINITSGVKGSQNIIYEDMPITPIDPISQESLARETTESPIDLYEAFVENDYVIKAGDELYCKTTAKMYKVRTSRSWPDSMMQLVLELQKSS